MSATVHAPARRIVGGLARDAAREAAREIRRGDRVAFSTRDAVRLAERELAQFARMMRERPRSR